MRKVNNELVNAFNTREHIELLNSFLGMDRKDDLLIDNITINGKRFTIFIIHKKIIKKKIFHLL